MAFTEEQLVALRGVESAVHEAIEAGVEISDVVAEVKNAYDGEDS